MGKMKRLIEEIADDYGVDFDTATEILQDMVEESEERRKEEERDRLLPSEELRD